LGIFGYVWKGAREIRFKTLALKAKIWNIVMGFKNLRSFRLSGHGRRRSP
jgi:hypothetical protein